MVFEIRYYTANSCKDDIEFVTEFPCFLGHPVFRNYEDIKNSENLDEMRI